MKKKTLSVAVSVALAAGTLVLSQGAEARDYTNQTYHAPFFSTVPDLQKGDTLSNSHFYGVAPLSMVHGGSVAKNVDFNNHSSFTSGESDGSDGKDVVTMDHITLNDFADGYIRGNTKLTNVTLKGKSHLLVEHGMVSDAVFNQRSSFYGQGGEMNHITLNDRSFGALLDGRLTDAHFKDKSRLLMMGGVANGVEFSKQSAFAMRDGEIDNAIFKDDASGELISGKLTDAHFKDNSFLQMIGGVTDRVEFTKQSDFAMFGGETDSAIFKDDASGELISGRLTDAHFKDNSFLQMIDGVTNGVEFSNQSTSAMLGGKLTDAHFNDQSQLGMIGGTANGVEFSKKSAFAMRGGEIDNAIFKDAASGELFSGKLTDAHFKDYSFLKMIGGVTDRVEFTKQSAFAMLGGETDNAIFKDDASGELFSGKLTDAHFNDQSRFVASSGELHNITLTDSAVGLLGGTSHATGLTMVKDHAVLNLVADPNHGAGSARQADHVVLNGGTLAVLAPAGVKAAHPEASVKTLTMNGGTVQFGDTAGKSGLAVDTLNGQGGTLAFNVSLADGTGNHLTAGTMEGHYNLLLNDATQSRAVTMQTLMAAANGNKLDLIKVTGSNKATYGLTGINGKKLDAFDLGDVLGEIKLEDSGDAVVIVPTQKTTRSTDAVLGALSSGQFIAEGEMQNVRSRRGELRNGGDEAGGAWGRYLNNNTHVRPGGMSGYSLEQNGMELGGDKVLSVGNDRVAVGMFGSYSKNRLKQDRGNSSNVDSWGTGVYATWFGAQGYYVDGVLKYSHFSTQVRSHTETGRGVSGEYDQNGLGASLETGYRFSMPAEVTVEPYVRATYFTADGKDVTLSNGLEAKAGRQESVRGEAGVAVDKRFELKNGMSVSPYVTAGVEQEFISNNSARVNGARDYRNDVAGTTGRYGAGVKAELTKTASVYAEADYRKGEHVESPLMANVGFRVNF